MNECHFIFLSLCLSFSSRASLLLRSTSKWVLKGTSLIAEPVPTAADIFLSQTETKREFVIPKEKTKGEGFLSFLQHHYSPSPQLQPHAEEDVVGADVEEDDGITSHLDGGSVGRPS